MRWMHTTGMGDISQGKGLTREEENITIDVYKRQGVTSHYMYMNSGKDSVLHAGPVWDLDNTMGRGFDKRNEFFANCYSLSSNQVSRWYARLCGNEAVSYTHLDVYKRQG